MLVTGATGFIGSRFAAHALEQGFSVRTLTRSDWHGSPVVPLKQRFFGSLPHEVPAEALSSVDVVVHCAATAASDEDLARSVNVEGTLRLARDAATAGVSVFVFLSSQSARDGAPAPYGRSKREAERALLEIEGIRVIILRPGLVTGAGSKGLFARMSKLVDRFPVIPVLGDGRAIIQPIHVDDLCEAIFRCLENSESLDRVILSLGDPLGIGLAGFLQLLSRVRSSREKPVARLPLAPIEFAVRTAERLGLRLPINSANLAGVKGVEPMDTTPSLQKLGLELRNLEEAVRPDDRLPMGISLGQRPVRVLLIGGGRVGFVHAVTLSRLPGIILAGVCDTNLRAIGLLRGMGLEVHGYTSLEQALRGASPDAVVIATPPVTHLSIARECVKRGLAVLIEKPLACRFDEIIEYENLAVRNPTAPILAGYVMLRNPHVGQCIQRLRAGEFGQVLGFTGITLVSLIQGRVKRRWEVKREVSGGGALINAGSHVLSMVLAAFGDPQGLEVQRLQVVSEEVEDSITVAFDYGGFRGIQYCSWSIAGFPRQENRLMIETDLGHLVMTTSLGLFIDRDGVATIVHALDEPVGFNLMPDYAGAGFTVEAFDLMSSARTRQAAGMTVSRALQIERVLFRAYDSANTVSRFATSPDATRSDPPSPVSFGAAASPRSAPAVKPRRVLDMRDLSASRATMFLADADSSGHWDEYLLTAEQYAVTTRSASSPAKIRLTVPDFLHQARLLATGGTQEVLGSMGLGGFVTGARFALPHLLRARSATFWVVAHALLGAALHHIPRRFTGTLLLHGYLTDFALGLRRVDMLDEMLDICGRWLPFGRVGFHTNLSSEALQALTVLRTRVDEVSVLTSPSGHALGETIPALRSAGTTHQRTITAEVGLAPAAVHRLASRFPEAWAFGAESILLSAAADETLQAEHRADLTKAWAAVFPGIDPPPGLL